MQLKKYPIMNIFQIDQYYIKHVNLYDYCINNYINLLVIIYYF
jgi:hypothetical protein